MAIRILFFILFFVACNSPLKKTDENQHSAVRNTDSDEKKLSERAYEYLEKKEYLKGILSYDTLISIDSTKGGYYFNRGNCKMMLLNDLSDADAIKDFYRAINCNYSKKQKAYFNIGVIYTSIGKLDSALYFYDEGLKIDPRDPIGLRNKKEVSDILKKAK